MRRLARVIVTPLGAPVVALLAALGAAGGAVAAEASRPEPVVLRAEVAAPRDEIWRALTTAEGARSFLAERALVDARVDGAFEMYFLPEQPSGLQGTEGARILAMEAPHRLMLSWNAPPRFGRYRDQRTVVEFELSPLANGRTLVTLSHGGWGRGVGWHEVRDYFARAWPAVLGRLQHRFARGPVDWDRPPGPESFVRFGE